jgi:hypothetical protein
MRDEFRIPRARIPAKRVALIAARPRLAAATALVALAWLAPGAALAARTPAASDPYVAASRATGVPIALLAAIAGVESDYHPWALDVAGREIYCRSRAEAERVLATSGDNVDIGLMQVNWKFWGPRLKVSKLKLLDPRNNLFFGALILKRCLSRGGDIWRRISDYHSGNAGARNRYNRRVYAKYLRYLRGDPR